MEYEAMETEQQASLAATRIQALYRGHKARKDIKRQAIAAIKIQSAIRCLIAKNRFKRVKPHLKIHKFIDSKLKTTRDRLVQKEREFQLLSLMSASRVKTYQTELREKAATIIQKHMRMWIAQARVSEMKRKRQAIVEELPKWQGDLDIADPTLTHVFHKAGFADIERATSKLMNKLFLDQQKRTARKAVQLDISHDTSVLLLSRLQRVSLLLDSYYSSQSELGMLKLQDLSLGTHRLRLELETYEKGLTDCTVSLESEPPNYPISKNALREAKRSHHLFKRRLDSPWWLKGGDGEIEESELEYICADADGTSDRIY